MTFRIIAVVFGIAIFFALVSAIAEWIENKE